MIAGIKFTFNLKLNEEKNFIVLLFLIFTNCSNLLNENKKLFPFSEFNSFRASLYANLP